MGSSVWLKYVGKVLKIVFKGRWLTCLTDTKPGYVIWYHLHIYTCEERCRITV